MFELHKQVLLHIYGMWRFRWYALIVTWLVAVPLWLYIYMMPDRYEGNARIYIDTESVLKPLLKGLAVETNVRTELDLVAKTLLSRPNLEKVIRETDLDYRAKNNLEMERLVKTLELEIKISPGERSNVFAITYADHDRKTARMVVQNLLDSLVEGTLGENRTDTAAAQRFLVQQIKEYEKRLVDAEQKLVEFKQKNVGMMPTEGRDYYVRLQAAMEELTRVSSDYKVALNRRNELRRQMEGEEPAFFGFSEPAQQNTTLEIDSRIQEYQLQLDKLQLKYTEEHPDIINIKEIIAQLRSERSEELKTLANVKPHIQDNPAMQQMRIASNMAEVDVAVLRGKRNEQQRKVEQLRKLVDTIPEVEANLKRLNRDYSVTKAQHENLLSRLETARLSEAAEKSSDNVEFRIIDPVNVPMQPNLPKRSLFLMLAVIISLAIGLGLALMLDRLRPVFFRGDQLKASLSLPVLGTISTFFAPKQRLKRRFELVSFVIAVSILMTAYGGAIIFQESAVRITQSLAKSIQLEISGIY